MRGRGGGGGGVGEGGEGRKKHAVSSYVCIRTVISCGLPI